MDTTYLVRPYLGQQFLVISSLPVMLFLSQEGSHHSTGLTSWPATTTPKWRWSPNTIPVEPVLPMTCPFSTLSPLHRHPAQVPVEGLQPEPVINNDTLAIDAEIVGKNHLAVIGGRDRGLNH